MLHDVTNMKNKQRGTSRATDALAMVALCPRKSWPR